LGGLLKKENTMAPQPEEPIRPYEVGKIVKTKGMERNELDLSFLDLKKFSDSSSLDVFVQMAEGNPGAASVLGRLINMPMGFDAIMALDDMNIRGTQIWVGFKDYCNQDIVAFIELVLRRNEGLVDRINMEGRRGNHPYKAVACKQGSKVSKREFLDNVVDEPATKINKFRLIEVE